MPRSANNPLGEPRAVNPRTVRLVGGLLVLLVGGVYLATLYPGVALGDSAEMQLMSGLLGVCHPPGYALEVLAGKLFTFLPLGPDFAWRVNLLQAVCGVLGLLALYGVVRRLTGQILPGVVAALTLTLSSVYWKHAVVAEVYVFHAMFLLIGLYAVIRFVEHDQARWLYLAAAMMGVCVGNRPSELLVMPAVVGFWWVFRRQARLNTRRICVVLLLGLLPFLLNVCFYVSRENPAYLHARDDALRDEILEIGVPFAERSFSQRLGEAVSYSLGLEASGLERFTEFSWTRIGWDLDKYAWIMSGLGALGNRYAPEQIDSDRAVWVRSREQGRGTCVGVLGLVLVGLSLRHWKRLRAVILLGLGMFVGNLIYYLYMHPTDNLHFTIPGLIGLAILVGLGTAVRRVAERRRGTLLFQVVCLTVPAFLLFANWPTLNYDSLAEQSHRRIGQTVRELPFPEHCVIVTNYPRAQALRCRLWLESHRPEISVMVFRSAYGPQEVLKLLKGLGERGYQVLLSAEVIGKESTIQRFSRWTPRKFTEVGLFLAPNQKRGQTGY